MNVISKPKTSDITTGPLPASRKIYVDGTLNPEIRVPMREIALHETAKEPPVVVYDTSGPYTDPAISIDIEAGLKRLREPWIKARGDVEEYQGREVKFEDNNADGEKLVPEFPALRKPLRAKESGKDAAVSQVKYARDGVITPEMEFIAIRENMGRKHDPEAAKAIIEAGESFGAAIPEIVTPEFVRDEVARGRAIIPFGVVAAAGAVVGQHPQLQPPTAPRPATASIAGRVVDATTGKPIAGGLLVLRALAS